MLSLLAPLIPGTEGWPLFKRNTSEQFEARVVMMEVTDSHSIFLKSMVIFKFNKFSINLFDI